ncbi:ABC-three component system middle component 1 [Idiomarina sp.]|uniref:ABC-three component system middle component 1 n=1 Tax=Idiomarina sp. TaxID=1874361 RepID=UPI0025B8CC69|nr:ABC-three component system middle component 1 [Idiomarina sp.]
MISIINNVLSNNGYELVSIELSEDIAAKVCLFSASKPCNREEYFVTLELNDQSDEMAIILLEKKAQELFGEISDSGVVDKTFEKNCTMIVCHEEARISLRTVLALEEDQYNFKKNVIAYDPQEVHAIEEFLAKESIERITNSLINNIITAEGGKNFLEFKKSHKSKKDHFSLILKIALKLPFITYIPREQELINLDQEVESSLSEEQSLIYDQLVNSDKGWDEENTEHQVVAIWGSLQ